MDVRTDNDFLLGSSGDVVAPTLGTVACRTRQQAYRTAVWLLLMGEVLPDEDPPSTYAEVEAAIRST